MSARWSIPAPVWVGHDYRLNGIEIGALSYDKSNIGRVYGEWIGWYGINNSDRSLYFRTEAEARAWVEAEVMRALGAEVME